MGLFISLVAIITIGSTVVCASLYGLLLFWFAVSYPLIGIPWVVFNLWMLNGIRKAVKRAWLNYRISNQIPVRIEELNLPSSLD